MTTLRSDRIVKVVDRGGKVVREERLVDYVEGPIERSRLAISLATGLSIGNERPKTRVCEIESCRKRFIVPTTGRVPRFCEKCRGEGQTKCAGWEESCWNKWPKPPRDAFERNRVVTRGGAPWRCASCAKRALNASRTQAQRDAIARRARSGTTPERLGAIARARFAAMSAEERSAFASKGAKSRTSTQQSVSSRKRWSRLSKDQRKAIAKDRRAKQLAGMSKEKRSEIGRKGQMRRTAEERRASVAKMHEGLKKLTREQRSENARRGNAKKTPEQRSEAARKSARARTKEQREESVRKMREGRAKLTPEQRSAIIRKGWIKRRKKRGAQ